MGEAASGEHTLALRPGGRWAVGSQPTRGGPSEVFFGPLTQEEAAMAAVSQRLRGRTDRNQAYASRFAERYHFPFLFAVDWVIVVLHTDEFVPTMLLRNVLHHLEFPCRHLR